MGAAGVRARLLIRALNGERYEGGEFHLGPLVDDRASAADRVAAADGQVRTDSFPWPAVAVASQLLEVAAKLE